MRAGHSELISDAFSKGMLLKNDPDSRKLLRNSNMTPEQIKAVYAAAVQKSNMWLDKHFILVQDELDISFDQAPLGEGGTAKVYSAMYKGQKVAVKVPHIRTGVAGVQDELDLKKEAYILAQLKSPHVVNVLGLVCLRPVAPMGLVMKFYPQSLEDFMRSDDFECLVMVDKVRMSLELAEGLFSLHDHPWKAIVHGDLKPSNVQVEQCLGGQWVCAIGDFGSAAISSTTRSFNTVNIAASGASSSFTWLYAAPEVVISNKKRPEADVYSLGLIIAQIFTGQEPYDGEPVVERVISWVKEKRPPMIVDPDPEVMPTAVHMLILGCLDQRPDLRPSAQQIVEVLGQLHRPGVTTLAASPPVSLDTLSPRPVHAPQVQPISFHVRKLGSSCFPAEQLDAAAALHILAAANDENTIKIASFGAIPLLVALLSSDLVAVQEQAVLVIKIHVVNDENKVKIASAGAIPPLVAMLSSKLVGVQEPAMWVLWSLATNADIKQHMACAIPNLHKLVVSTSSEVFKAAALSVWTQLRDIEVAGNKAAMEQEAAG